MRAYDPNIMSDGTRPYTSASDVILANQKKEPNAVASFAGNIIKPFEEVGQGVLNQARKLGIGDLQNGGVQTQSTGLFGNKVNPIGYKDGQELSVGGTAKQLVGDAAQMASFVVPGASIKNLAVSGALQAGGETLANGGSIKDVAKSSLEGGTAGATIGVVGKGISALVQKLPERIVRQFVPGINNETTDYAIKKGLGSPTKMLAESDASIEHLGESLGKVLKNPSYANSKASGNEILSQVALTLKDSGMTADSVAENLKKVVPLKAALVDKFRKGTLPLDDLQRLNSSIGKATFKSVLDNPEVKANKEVASSAYHVISEYIKKTAPESVPLYEQLAKEYQLNPALQKLIRNTEKAKTLTLKDLAAAGFGFTAGPIGALGAVALEKAATNPTVNLIAAKGVAKATNETAKKVGRGILKATTLGSTNIVGN